MSYQVLHSTMAMGGSLEDNFSDSVLESNLNLNASFTSNGNLVDQLFDDVALDDEVGAAVNGEGPTGALEEVAVAAEMNEELFAGGAGHGYEEGEEGENLSDSAPPKKKKKTDSANGDQIRKNRNAFRQFLTLKNKIESFQGVFGADQNFIVIMENNFIHKVGTSGPIPKTEDKTLVFGNGKLMEMFKSDELLYDMNSMEVLKLGAKSLVDDRDFLKECTKSKRRPSQMTVPALQNEYGALLQQQVLQQQLLHQQYLQQQQQHQQQQPILHYPQLVSSPMLSTQSARFQLSPIQLEPQNASTTTPAAAQTQGTTKQAKKSKPKRSEVFNTSLEESFMEDRTDYSEDD